MRILIADDSIAFRAAIKAALVEQPEVTAIGVASTGSVALGKLRNDGYDLIVLDMEMPDGDGIDVMTAIKAEGIPTKAILFAAPTPHGYEKVRQALALGAADFLAKPKGEAGEGVNGAIERIRSELVPRIRSLLSQPRNATRPVPAPSRAAPRTSSSSQRLLESFTPDAIVIASSTGGPMALERFFQAFQPPLRLPIFICQHMPPPFTRELAARISQLCQVPAAEGIAGEAVAAGKIYVAPADFHMRLVRTGTVIAIDINKQPPMHFVRPAADPLFKSAADLYRSSLMGFILTGMGEDGKDGAAYLRQLGGAVMIQDKESSVVWGMPGSAFDIGAYDRIGTPEECGALAYAMARLR